MNSLTWTRQPPRLFCISSIGQYSRMLKTPFTACPLTLQSSSIEEIRSFLRPMLVTPRKFGGNRHIRESNASKSITVNNGIGKQFKFLHEKRANSRERKYYLNLLSFSTHIFTVSPSGSRISQNVFNRNITEGDEIDSEVDEVTQNFEYKEGASLSVHVLKEMGFYQVELTVPEEGTTLHWAVDDWCIPDSSLWPGETATANESKALETPFTFVCRDHWQVLVRFPVSVAPRRLVCVLRDKDDQWYNNGGCFAFIVKPLEMKDLLDQIVVPETTYNNWSLFSRFILACEILDSAEALDADGMALVYTWLRFSVNKELKWYHHCNYQSKDIAHVEERLASSMAEKVRSGKSYSVKRFARMALAILPRGGGDSEQIRMGILNIMREHGIKEGHRPGLDERFLEQWHQKLHTNTSPEDIHICEAYLEFLHTKSMDAFYRILWENGGISKEWLHTMDHPITAEPVFLPHLAPAFKLFLWVLKTVHSGADLDVALEMSKRWIPGKIVDARQRLKLLCEAKWTSRDVLLLDIALENCFGLSITRIDKSSLSGDDLCELISLVLENACIAFVIPDLTMSCEYWAKVKRQKRWTKEWAFLSLAAVDRISQALQGYMDEIYRFVQPHAESLGRLCGIPESCINNFGEEVVRGQPIFILSILLQKLQPMLRVTAGLGSWQVASHQARVTGNLMVLSSLGTIQGHVFTSPHVLLTDWVGGLEDIPVGVTAVLSTSTTDVLSHIAIRARNSKVLLASCFDPQEFSALKSLQETWPLREMWVRALHSDAVWVFMICGPRDLHSDAILLGMMFRSDCSAGHDF